MSGRWKNDGHGDGCAVNDTELRIKGIEALNRDLGPVLALRFLEPAPSRADGLC